MGISVEWHDYDSGLATWAKINDHVVHVVRAVRWKVVTGDGPDLVGFPSKQLAQQAAVAWAEEQERQA